MTVRMEPLRKYMHALKSLIPLINPDEEDDDLGDEDEKVQTTIEMRECVCLLSRSPEGFVPSPQNPTPGTLSSESPIKRAPPPCL
jgi:hypothetical protein